MGPPKEAEPAPAELPISAKQAPVPGTNILNAGILPEDPREHDHAAWISGKGREMKAAKS